MSKNIKIAEGGQTQIYNNITKLKTKSADSTTDIMWIPEDEVDDYATTAPITIKANGVYESKANGVAGYDTVTVEVPERGGIKEVSGLVESLKTRLSNYILQPNIIPSTTSYEWKEGRDGQGNPIRTFKGSSSLKWKEYIDVSGKEVNLMFDKLIEPNDYNNIGEAQVELAKDDYGNQLYFKSISNFTLGLTTISPRDLNNEITPYIEDMYKCRSLKKISGLTKKTCSLYSHVTSATVGNDTVYMDDAGLKFNDGRAEVNFKTTSNGSTQLRLLFTEPTMGSINGVVVDYDTSGESAVTNIYQINDGNEYLLRPEQVYDDISEAQADATLPLGGIARIKQGSVIPNGDNNSNS